MLTAEYNTKYAQILNRFGLLRKWRTDNVRWGMRAATHISDSRKLFLYLRTLNRYSPGINLTDTELAILFKNALTIVSGFSFLEYESIVSDMKASNSCGCFNAQNIVNIIQNIVGTEINDDKIPFTVTEDSPVVSWDYVALGFKAIYGNNPSLAMYDSAGEEYPEDKQTAPYIVYTVPGDPTTDIVSIRWEIGGPGVSGYIRISGKPFSSNSGGSGGTGAGTLTFTQANLLSELVDDGMGGTTPQWYLPLSLAPNKRPTFVMYNNEEISTTYSKKTTPAKLYGFPSNEVATIEVTVI